LTRRGLGQPARAVFYHEGMGPVGCVQVHRTHHIAQRNRCVGNAPYHWEGAGPLSPGARAKTARARTLARRFIGRSGRPCVDLPAFLAPSFLGGKKTCLWTAKAQRTQSKAGETPLFIEHTVWPTACWLSIFIVLIC